MQGMVSFTWQIVTTTRCAVMTICFPALNNIRVHRSGTKFNLRNLAFDIIPSANEFFRRNDFHLTNADSIVSDQKTRPRE